MARIAERLRGIVCYSTVARARHCSMGASIVTSSNFWEASALFLSVKV